MKIPYAGAPRRVTHPAVKRRSHVSEKTLAADFGVIEVAVAMNERCPKSYPDGPLQRGSISELFKRGMIRSAVYAKNYRVITILTGPHAGESTKAHPTAEKPWLINGKLASWLKE
jgi:hypothetical protein